MFSDYAYRLTHKNKGVIKFDPILRDFAQDTGRLRSFAAFEVVETKGKKIFHGREHFRRLQRSMKELNIGLPEGIKRNSDLDDFLEEKIKDLIRRNKLREALVRVEITGGTTLDGFHPEGSSSLFIFVWPFKAPTLKEGGFKVYPIPLKREMPHVKTSNYCACERMLKGLKGWDDVLYAGDNKFLEGSTSNAFFVKRGEIITAPFPEVLEGITREVIMKLAKKIRYKVSVRTAELDELKEADEVFLTNTSAFIKPVTKLGDVFEGPLGPVTRQLWEEFLQYREKYYAGKEK